MTTTTEIQATGNVTIDDVRAALGEGDAMATNAGALRKVLGRGSQTTIQKHLDAIRLALAAPALEAEGKAPDVPKDVMQALWAVAWSAAQASASGALARAQQHAEMLTAQLVVAQSDSASAHADVDAMTDALAVQQAQAIGQQDISTQALDAVQREAEAQQQQIADLRSELAQQAQQHAAQAQAQAHAQALAQAQADAVSATLRGELDRHVSQLADLRAALGKTEKAEKGQPEQGSIL